jgi:hypothetical protein
MVLSRSWQSGTALTLTMTIASSLLVPILWNQSATAAPDLVAQTFPESWRRSAVPSGTLVPVRYDKAERVILKPDETVPLTLTVTRDVLTARGTVLIPSGSEVEGELRPAEGGTQFVAETLRLAGSDRSYAIDATSSPITQTETITRRTNPDILRGAAIGGAAAAVLAEIFGRIDPLEVIGGAGLGVLAEVLLRRRQEVEVIVVEPETDIDLRLQSDLALE